MEAVKPLAGIATGAVIELLDGDEMVYRATSGTAAPFKGVRLQVASSLSGACVHLGEVLVSHDTALDSRVDQAALAASAERTRRILESANDAFVAINSDGIITEWNHQAEMTFGWQRNEAIGQRLSTMLIPLEHRHAHESGLHRFVANGQGAAVNNRIELMASTKDRGEIAVELIISAIQFIQQADTALYQAKAAGRNTFRTYRSG